MFKIDPFLQNVTLQTDFYEAAKAIVIDTFLKVNTNVSESLLQSTLQFKLPLIDNTVTLKLTAPAAIATTTPKVETTDAVTTTTTTTDEINPIDTTPVVIEETPVFNGTIYKSPLLTKNDYHQVLLNRVKLISNGQQANVNKRAH
jgi:hypothetical protein